MRRCRAPPSAGWIGPTRGRPSRQDESPRSEPVDRPRRASGQAIVPYPPLTTTSTTSATYTLVPLNAARAGASASAYINTPQCLNRERASGRACRWSVAWLHSITSALSPLSAAAMLSTASPSRMPTVASVACLLERACGASLQRGRWEERTPVRCTLCDERCPLHALRCTACSRVTGSACAYVSALSRAVT